VRLGDAKGPSAVEYRLGRASSLGARVLSEQIRSHFVLILYHVRLLTVMGKWFTRAAADLGFESTLISGLLRGDPTRIYIREMLTKARSREEFDYGIERWEQAHYELLQEIHSLEARSGQSPPILWTSTATDVKVDRRYGRPYDGALKECAPSSFATSGKIQTVGRFMTNLFVKGGITQLFFRMPRLNLERVLPQGVGEAAVRAPGMDGMLSMVKRRVGIIEQEARDTHDLQADLEAARETIAAQRQRLGTLEELGEARSQVTALQEKHQMDISSLEEALRVAQDENEAVQKEAEGTSNLRAELSTVKAESEPLRNREAEVDRQIRANTETWRIEEVRIHDLEQSLTEARSSPESTSTPPFSLAYSRSTTPIKSQAMHSRLPVNSARYLFDVPLYPLSRS
jgi:hypothetical protein